MIIFLCQRDLEMIIFEAIEAVAINSYAPLSLQKLEVLLATSYAEVIHGVVLCMIYLCSVSITSFHLLRLIQLISLHFHHLLQYWNKTLLVDDQKSGQEASKNIDKMNSTAAVFIV